MRLQKITKRWAEKHKACGSREFFELFPDGLDLTDAEQVQKAWRKLDMDDIAWFLGIIGVRVPCYSDPDHQHTCSPYNAEAKDGEVYSRRAMRPYAKKAGLPI